MISLSARLTLILSEWRWPLLDAYMRVSKNPGCQWVKGTGASNISKVYLCMHVYVRLCNRMFVRTRVCDGLGCVRACGGMLNVLDHPQTPKTCFDFPLHGERESNPLRIPPLEVFSCHKPPFNRQNPTWVLYSLLVLLDDWGGEKA